MILVLLIYISIIQRVCLVSIAHKAENENCRQKLGIEDGTISDSSITASSSLSKRYAPYNGRLNYKTNSYRGGAWVARKSDNKQWFQVQFSQFVDVTGVVTQGRDDSDDWVTSYMLSYSRDGVEFHSYHGRENNMIFYGNKDRHTVVKNILQPPITGIKFIRIHPIMWQRRIGLRAEFIGCSSVLENSKEETDKYMSYLNVPRLHFLGRFQADTCTVNNKVANYDISRFTQRNKVSSLDDRDGGGGWNPKGTNDWRIDECKVTSVCYDDGKCKTWSKPIIQQIILGEDKKDDPVLGSTVADDTSGTAAKVVDLDPQDMEVSTVYGWRIRVGSLFSADFRPTPLKGYWTKLVNASVTKGDSGSGGEYQSVLTNIKWLEKANSSRFVNQIRNVMQKIGSKELSIKFNVDSFDMNQSSPLFTWGRIAGVIGVQGPSAPPFYTHGRVLRPQQETLLVPSQFTIDPHSQLVSVDLGNALPIAKKGVSPDWLGTLAVGFNEDIDANELNCSSKIKWLGEVPYSKHLWYRNTTGVVSFAINVEDMQKLSNRRFLLAQVTGNQSTWTCSQIMWAEAKNGLEVRPCGTWVFRKEAFDTVTMKVFVTEFGKLKPDVEILFGSAGSSGYINEPVINFPTLYTARGPIRSNVNGTATITIYTRDPGNPRKTLDGQIYKYSYGLSVEELSDKDKSIRIHVYDNYTYTKPSNWITHVYPIFKQYANLFPVMTDHFLDLGNYEEVVKSKELIAMSMNLPESHPNYMPVTRDLSRAKRQMILEWLGQKHPLKGKEEDMYTLERLREHLQIALQIEHATIPPYLTALVSIKPGFNSEVKRIIKTIIRQEMLHMALVSNLLNAIGGKPKLYYRDFILRYPSRLPGDVHPHLVVPLEKCSVGLIRNVFMKIEEPIVTEQLITNRKMLWEIYHRNMDFVDGNGNAYVKDIGNHKWEMMTQFDDSENKNYELNNKRQFNSNYESERRTGSSHKTLDDSYQSSSEYSKTVPQKRNINHFNEDDNSIPTGCIHQGEKHHDSQTDDSKPDLQGQLGNFWNIPFHRHHNTIGGLYIRILKALSYLTNCGQNNSIFTGDPTRQITPEHWMSHQKSEKPNVFRVEDYKSAVKAVKEIMEQGEGSSPCNPLAVYANHTTELSHYFLFSSIVEGFNITVYPKGKDSSKNEQGNYTNPMRCDHMYNFDGQKIPFDPNGVWPIITNPQMSKYLKTRIFKMAKTFNKVYTQLLKNLERVFNGHPDAIKDTMGLMYSVTLYAKRLVSTPLHPNGDPNIGPNAAPTYTFISE